MHYRAARRSSIFVSMVQRLSTQPMRVLVFESNELMREMIPEPSRTSTSLWRPPFSKPRHGLQTRSAMC